MKNIFKKKVNVFGKSIPVLAIFVLGIALVSAGLLTHYGQIQQDVDVQQAVTLDGDNCDGNVCEESSTPTFNGDVLVSEVYSVENIADTPRSVELVTSCRVDDGNEEHNCAIGEVDTSYVKPVALDDNIDFGSSANEIVAIVPTAGLTLNSLFSGAGLQYTYTVLNGGQLEGASPVMAVIDLVGGRHVILYPGMGDRDGTHTLQFSDDVASDSGGDGLVDFTVYASDFQGGAQWSSNSEYGNWNYLKATGSSTGAALPISWDDVVTRVSLMTQAGSTGQKDQIESMLIDGVSYTFVAGVSENKFTIQAGDSLSFVVSNTFNGVGDYTITTEVLPA